MDVIVVIGAWIARTAFPERIGYALLSETLGVARSFLHLDRFSRRAGADVGVHFLTIDVAASIVLMGDRAVLCVTAAGGCGYCRRCCCAGITAVWRIWAGLGKFAADGIDDRMLIRLADVHQIVRRCYRRPVTALVWLMLITIRICALAATPVLILAVIAALLLEDFALVSDFGDIAVIVLAPHFVLEVVDVDPVVAERCGTLIKRQPLPRPSSAELQATRFCGAAELATHLGV